MEEEQENIERSLPAHEYVKSQILSLQSNMYEAFSGYIGNSTIRDPKYPERLTSKAMKDTIANWRAFQTAVLLLHKLLTPHYKSANLQKEADKVFEKINQCYINLGGTEKNLRISRTEWKAASDFLDKAIFELGVSKIELPSMMETDDRMWER